MKKYLLCLFLIPVLLLTACADAPQEDDPPALAYDATPQIAFNSHYVRTFWREEFQPLRVIHNREELVQFLEHSTALSWSQQPNANLIMAIANYNDAFFEEKYLIVVSLGEASGSIRHEVKNITENGDIIIRRILPGVGTADIADWYVIIEIGAYFRPETFNVVFENDYRW